MLALVRPELDAVAAVDFVHGGRQFVAGEAFPHKGIHPNALRGLTFAGLIRFVEADAALVAAAPAVVEPVAATPTALPTPRPAPSQHHKHRR